MPGRNENTVPIAGRESIHRLQDELSGVVESLFLGKVMTEEVLKNNKSNISKKFIFDNHLLKSHGNSIFTSLIDVTDKPVFNNLQQA